MALILLFFPPSFSSSSLYSLRVPVSQALKDFIKSSTFMPYVGGVAFVVWGVLFLGRNLKNFLGLEIFSPVFFFKLMISLESFLTIHCRASISVDS
jgi:hypothetical protein